MQLKRILPLILPDAIAWVEAQAEHARIHGVALDGEGEALARAVGVSEPGRIRLLEVDAFPQPPAGLLRRAAEYTGMLGPGTAGVTFGHSVLIRCGLVKDLRLLSHEFRHVHQYEQAGSIAAYLTEYLGQLAEVGYEAAPFEVDARRHELSQRHVSLNRSADRRSRP